MSWRSFGGGRGWEEKRGGHGPLVGRPQEALAEGLQPLRLLVLQLVEVVDGTAVAPTRHPILAYSIEDHSLLKALLEATVLTAVSLLLRHWAGVGSRDAVVHALVLHRPLEESFAPFAGVDAIVKPGGFVRANGAELRIALQILSHEGGG